MIRPAPRRLGQAVIVCLAGSALAIAAAPGSRAQTAAPITVIPPSIAPAPTATLPPPEFPTTGTLDAPNGSGGLALVPSTFVVEGGFAELAQRIQRPLHVRSGHLVNLHHIRLATIEQALALAADLPGVTLRSTLARGERPGGTVLEIEGRHVLASGAIGADNAFDPSPQTYGVNAQISLNSAFGRGEQIYGLAVSGYDLSRFFASDARVRVLGGGAIVPFARGRLTVNPEITYAGTAPVPVVGAPPHQRRVAAGLIAERVCPRQATDRTERGFAGDRTDRRAQRPARFRCSAQPRSLQCDAVWDRSFARSPRRFEHVGVSAIEPGARRFCGGRPV